MMKASKNKFNIIKLAFVTCFRFSIVSTIFLFINFALAQDGSLEISDQTADDIIELKVVPEQEIDATSVEQADLIAEQEVVLLRELEASEAEKNIFDRQLIAQLNAKEQEIIQAVQKEEAFSPRLGEIYLEYGSLLKRMRRWEEANDILGQALHIQKINNGIYSSDQLHVLKELMDLASLSRDEERVEAHLSRAALISDENQQIEDDQSLIDIFITAGHYFLDQYYLLGRRSIAQRTESLIRANNAFQYVIRRYQFTTFDEYSLPYGELLLISHLENNLALAAFSAFNRNAFGSALSGVEFSSEQDSRYFFYLRGAYERGQRYLGQYLDKARREGSHEEIFNALIAVADTHFLRGDVVNASKNYKAAWEHGQKYGFGEFADMELNNPKQLPAYPYLLERDTEVAGDFVSVPLAFSLSSSGRVTNIQPIEDESLQEYYNKARLQLRELNFRPAIVNGSMVAMEEYIYPIDIATN